MYRRCVTVYARMVGAGRILARNDRPTRSRVRCRRSSWRPPRGGARPWWNASSAAGHATWGPARRLKVGAAAAPPAVTVTTAGAVSGASPRPVRSCWAGAFAMPHCSRRDSWATGPWSPSLRSLTCGRAPSRPSQRGSSRAHGHEPALSQRHPARDLPARVPWSPGRTTTAVDSRRSGVPDQQTTLVVEERGQPPVVAPRGRVPSRGRPRNAFDDNTLTAWQFGGFGQSERQPVSRTFPGERAARRGGGEDHRRSGLDGSRR